MDKIDADSLYWILSFVAPDDLARLACVNKKFKEELERPQIWTTACKTLWKGKLHVHPHLVFLLGKKLSKQALHKSWVWGKSQCISRGELASRSWRTAYKPSMFHQLLYADPFHQGRKARIREFKLTGRMYTPPDSASMEWTDISAWTWRLKRLCLGDNKTIQLISYRASNQDFPELIVYHLPNWGWVLASEYVLMASFDFTKEQFNELIELCPRYHGVDY